MLKVVVIKRRDCFQIGSFFLKFALAIQSLLQFHRNFRIVLFTPASNATGILIGNELNLVRLWKVCTFNNTNSFDP